jgi:hypothetical protein
MRILVAEDDAPLADLVAKSCSASSSLLRLSPMASNRKSWLRIKTTLLSSSTLRSPVHGASMFCAGFAPKSRTFRFSS